MENNIVKNEGYNYYYGVKDNPDLMQWMRDIDDNINYAIKNIQGIRGRVDSIEDAVEEHANAININADVLDGTRSAMGWLSIVLGMATGLSLLIGCIAMDMSEKNADDIELVRRLAYEACRKAGVEVEVKEKEE